MTGFLRRILNKIRITVLILLVILNAMSALIIALAVDSIPLRSWPIWILFAVNLGFLWLMAYANGWVYGTRFWWIREMKKMYTCTDCIHKNSCPDRSRNYCCTSFKPKEEVRDHGQRKGSGKQGEAVPQG